MSASVLHPRFQLWQSLGVFEGLMKALATFYSKKRRIKWKWQVIDSKSVPWNHLPAMVVVATLLSWRAASNWNERRSARSSALTG